MVILQNRLTKRDEPAQLVSPIAQEDIDCYLSEWRPVLDAKVVQLKNTGQYTLAGLANHNVEDAHWKWPEKTIIRAGQLQWNSFALRCEGKTQGLMFVDMLRRCRHPSQLNEHMVYIDLVSTAPWNRPRLSPQPVYRGVGLVLMTEAILLSQDEGFGGRIGLHALPGAEPWYKNEWRMEALGPDPAYSNLQYFEMTADRATEFLNS